MAFTSSTTTNTGSSSSNTIVLFAEKNQPWDVIRFVQQSSKFVSIFPQQGTKRTIIPGTVLWKAGATTTKENDFEFAPLDDVVMGGASKSNFNTGTGKWKGVVTDANNGGFVGIRSTPIIDYDLSKCNGIEWSILTTNTKDSMRLKVVLRDTTDFNGIGWTTSKDTNKKSSLSSKSSTITTFKIPFDNKTLKPSKFAKILTETDIKEPFNTTNIKSFQLTYSKFEYDGILNPKFNTGEFEIQLIDIKTY
ncbi:CIA30-domain-containing protein [Fragilariopsis cylindrus CCMP1102]|uniref:CIA30-domain-containing protein n=1 Tax=Fragilariopsis cylindrus CCMP1102 TaxID=635003 RepID=A0A1E7EP67_9STRA|nr:CIA30-domain-containing protein [Fragilariopsis cylindrus CCMP1102]|eukprot:OEU07654.1 CIA30-domain-containing protein [Fragilariopsis cylindrus CCMP1102]